MGPPVDLYGAFLWNVGYAICHQLPDRSFVLGGLQMPMCARDTGTYLGYLVVLGLFFFRRRYNRSMLPDRTVLAASVIGVMFYAFDAVSSYLGFRTTTNDLRLIAGLAFGSGISFLLLTVASIVLYKASDRSRTFTYHDMVIVYPLLALLTIPLFLNLGIFGYYLEATLVIFGLLFAFFIITMVLVGALTSWNLVNNAFKRKIIISSIMLESSILIGLWVAKYFAWPLVQIPGA